MFSRLQNPVSANLWFDAAANFRANALQNCGIYKETLIKLKFCKSLMSLKLN
jgi:hypothetical protein